MALKLECGYLKGFIGEHEYAAMASQVENAHALLQRLPSVMRPQEIPATGALIGTPASINASVEPQMEP